MKRGYFILVLSCLAWNAGGQNFTSVNTGITGTVFSSSAWADYDMDGDPDLLMTGSTSAIMGTFNCTTKLYRNDGSAFTEIMTSVPGINSGSVDWGDYDRDGDPDILISGNIGSNQPVCKVYRNDGGGNFTDINAGMIGAYSSCAKWGDYDQDGYLDLLLIGGDAAVTQWYVTKLYRNNRNHTFTEITTTITPSGNGNFDWGDYDNDGDQDLVIAASTFHGFKTCLYRNDGNAVFTMVDPGIQGLYQSGVEFGDYDNDGLLDILAAGRGVYAFYSLIYHNNGNGSFTNINAGMTGVAAADAEWGDYDGDCDLDVLLSGYLGTINDNRMTKIYRNDGNNIFTESTGSTLEGVSEPSVNWVDYDNDGDQDVFTLGSNNTFAPYAALYRNNINLIPGSTMLINAIDDVYSENCIAETGNYNVLSNDNIHPDSVNLSVVSVRQGQAIVQPDKTILYISNQNSVTTDTVIYQVCGRYCNRSCDQAKLILCRKNTTTEPEQAPVPLFIPNLVSPNGDGRNDYFEITGLPTGCHLTICNRWGDVVFTSNDYKNDWSGEALSNDVYYYQLLNKNDSERYKGWVQLLK